MPHYGLWVQSEIVLLIFHTASAICAIGLIGCVYSLEHNSNNIKLTLPAVFALSIFILSLLSLPFREFPILHLWGLPEHGEGALLYLSVFIIIIGFFYSNQKEWMRMFLEITLTVLIFFLAFVTTFNNISIEKFDTILFPPYFFRDYLAFFSLFGIYVSLNNFKENKILFYMLFSASIYLLVISENLSAQITIPIVAIICFLTKKSLNYAALRPPLLYGLGFFLIISIFLFSFVFSNAISVTSSFGSRIHLHLIWYEAITNNILNFLGGYGFGNYEELLILYSNQTGIATYSSGELPFWDTYRRVDFSSHNAFLDIFGSTGIFGFFLYSMFFMSTFLLRPIKAINVFMCVSVIILSSMWFLMPGVMAVFAYCLTLRNDTNYNVINLSKKSLLYLFLSSAICIVSVIYLSVKPAIEIKNYQQNKISDLKKCHSIFKDEKFGGYYTAKLLRSAFNLEGTNVVKNYEQYQADNFYCLFLSSETQLNHSPSLMLLVSNLSVRSDLLIHSENYPGWKTLQNKIATNWDKRIIQLVDIAPQRHDLLIPYLTWKISKKDFKESMNVIEYSLKKSPDNAIGLWFKGVIGLETGSNKKESIKYLKKALINGVERFLHISNELKLK